MIGNFKVNSEKESFPEAITVYNYLEFIVREETSKNIKLNVYSTYRPKTKTGQNDLERKLEYTKVYHCSRNGESRLRPNSTVKVNRIKQMSKVGNCPCRLEIKKYVDNDKLEVTYNSLHSHPIGIDNVKFIRVSSEFREKVKEMFKAEISVRKVRDWIREHGSDREYVISNKDLSYLKNSVDLKSYAFHKKDIISTGKWIKVLEQTGELMYKL